MTSPLITTVIPTYRRPQMLRRAIQSVLSQTFSDFSLCVYDNASGDETSDVVEWFQKRDSRVQYVRRPVNLGAYINFTEGADKVTTPYFSFLPDDDVLLPNFFADAVEGFRQHPQATISLLTTLHMSASGYLYGANILRWPEGLLVPPAAMVACMRYGNPGLPSMLVKHSAWRELGGWDQGTAPSDDLDFELRAAARYPFVVSRTPGAIQVMHEAATTAGGGLNWVWPSIPRIIEKIRTDESIPADARDYVVQRLEWWLHRGLLTRGVLRSLIAGRSDEARRASDLMRCELGQERLSKLSSILITGCDHIIGLRAIVGAIVHTRVWLHDHAGLSEHLKFKHYASYLAMPSEPPADVPELVTALVGSQ